MDYFYAALPSLNESKDTRLLECQLKCQKTQFDVSNAHKNCCWEQITFEKMSLGC